MHLSEFRLENYKSIFSSGHLSFTPDFNVIVGPNNVGKTALVEGLSLAFGNMVHLSLKTSPFRNAPIPSESQASCTIHLPGDEMRDLFLGLQELYVPLLSNGDEALSIRRFNELLATGADLMFQWEVNTLRNIQLRQYP